MDKNSKQKQKTQGCVQIKKNHENKAKIDTQIANETITRNTFLGFFDKVKKNLKLKEKL